MDKGHILRMRHRRDVEIQGRYRDRWRRALFYEQGSVDTASDILHARRWLWHPTLRWCGPGRPHQRRQDTAAHQGDQDNRTYPQVPNTTANLSTVRCSEMPR